MDVDEIVKNVLAHHGVKGQKWGVRRAEKKTAKIDARFEKRPTNPKHILSDRIALHNSVHDIMNYHIGRINSKPEYVKAANDGILADDNHPTTKKYLKEYMDTYVSELNKSAKNMGMNASGTREFGVRAANDFLGFQIYARDVKHASENSFDIKFVRDDKGRVMDLILDSIAQGVLAVDNVLAHHGVKGMRWGVTRSKGSSPQAVTTDVKRVRGHSQVKTSGGKHQPVHEDAIKARSAAQKLKSSGKDTLSNQELQQLASRLDLEQRVARLSGTQGKGFVKTFLSKPQNQQKIADVAVREGTKQVAKVIAKKAAAAATTP